MVYLPTDVTTRLIRSQQALCFFYVTSLWGRTQTYLNDLSKLLDSIAYSEFNDMRCQSIKCVETFNKSFVALSIASMLSYGNSKKLETSATTTKKDDDDAAESADKDNTNSNNNNNTRSAKGSKVDNAPMNWACTFCGCLHVPEESDLLFDDLMKDNGVGGAGTLQFVDVTEKRRASKNSTHKLEAKLPTQYRWVCYNSSNKIVCGNCFACQAHNDIDCRICFGR